MSPAATIIAPINACRCRYKVSPAIPALISLLSDPDLEVRASAAWHLGEIGRETPGAARALMDALCDQHWEVRRWAAMWLSEFEDDVEIVNLLRNAVRDENEWVRHSATLSLRSIDARAHEGKVKNE